MSAEAEGHRRSGGSPRQSQDGDNRATSASIRMILLDSAKAQTGGRCATDCAGHRTRESSLRVWGEASRVGLRLPRQLRPSKSQSQSKSSYD